MLPYIDAPFIYVADRLGASPDELKLIVSFLASYPLAGLLKRIPDQKIYEKNIFIICVSLFYLIGLFDLGSGVRTLAVSSLGAYLIAQSIEGPYMPWIGFVFLMGHLSVSHIRRHTTNNPASVDITGAQMVLVMKLTAFCWNVHDGKLPEAELDAFQKEHAIKEIPEPMDFAGYVLFFPSLMAGPAFDYIDYRRWLEGTMFQLPPGTDPAKAPPTRKKRKIPRSGTPAAFKAVIGLLWILAFLVFSGWYHSGVILGDEFLTYSLPRRIWNLHMLGLTTRMKYYGVWSLTEGACILSGIGYRGVNPQTGRADWDRLQNVNPLGIELAQNSRAYLGNWNINTNNWLRNCMYLRVTPKGKKPGFRASMATFVTSAFWHGFEPGYYMTFVLASFIQTIAKNCRTYIRPFFLTPDGTRPTPSKRYFDIASWLATQLAFSFTTAPFVLLSLSGSLAAWSRVYYYVIAAVAASLLFFASPAKPYLRSQIAARKASASATGPSPSTDAATAKRRPSGSGAKKRGRGGEQPSEQFEKFELDGQLDARPGGQLGLPDDPGQDLDEMMEELRREVQARRDRGMSIGQGLQEAVKARMSDREKGAGESVGGAEVVS